MERSGRSDTEPMTAVLKRRKELKRALRLAQVLVALDHAAAAARTRPRTRPRATLGKA